jgi:subtilisin family serine protease
MPVQISDGGDYFLMSDVADGILYALNHGADVINLSLGKMFGPGLSGRDSDELQRIIENTGKDEEQFWKELFDLADRQNTSIVLAAGNENVLIGLDPMQRSDKTIKVVAVDKNLSKADFSNYCLNCSGSQNYISAPGVQVVSAVPGNAFMPMDGTSMAAPIVSGAIALIKSRNKTMLNTEIMSSIQRNGQASRVNSIPPIMRIDRVLLEIR